MPAVTDGRIGTSFGVRGRYWACGFHTGVDYLVRYKPVYARAKGRVVFRGYGGWGRAYGLHVIVQYGDGRRGLFAHLSAIRVKAGQVVKPGTRIGTSGNTGNTTGPHLHYEERVRPYRYGSDARRPIHNVGGSSPVKRPIPPAWQSSKSVVRLANLKPGKTNVDVRDLQNALIKKGFWKKGQKVTGYYGPITKAYVKKFQQKQGWRGSNADGVPGPQTVKKLGLKVG